MINLGDLKDEKAKDRLHTTLVWQLFMILKKKDQLQLFIACSETFQATDTERP